MNNRQKIKEWVDWKPRGWKSMTIEEMVAETKTSRRAVYTYLPFFVCPREGITPSGLWSARRKAGCTRLPVDVDKLIKLHEEGMGPPDIAHRLNCSVRAVQSHLSKRKQ